MTKRIQLHLGSESLSTVISNIFIDKYMTEANGSYVKVYIYLLRCLSDPSMDVSVSGFSEKLDETEKDIIRALKYWEKKKLLSITWDEDGQISNLTITQLGGMPGVAEPVEEPEPVVTRRPDAAVSASGRSVAHKADNVSADFGQDDYQDDAEGSRRIDIRPSADLIKAPNYTPSQIASLKKYDDFEELVDYVEGRLGTLNQTKLNSLAFIYEILDMNSELIRYLYDYCIFKGKTGSTYLEKVAIAWKNKEIDTVEKARQETFSRSKECNAVKNSFGLQRSLGGVELEYISRWSQEYGMTPEVIKEACDRTLMQTSKPDFKYADKILQDWRSNNVKTLEDVSRLDLEYRNRNPRPRSKQPEKTASSGNKFTQFPQREYSDSDFAAIERKKISNNNK